MAKAQFSQSFIFYVPLAKVQAMLMDFTNIDKYHPLVVKSEELPSDTSQFGSTRRRFEITDITYMGPIRLKFKYLATSTLDTNGQIYTEAFQSLNVHLISQYILTQNGDETSLIENCEIQAPAIFQRYVRNQAKTAHFEMLSKMKAYLESTETLAAH